MVGQVCPSRTCCMLYEKQATMRIFQIAFATRLCHAVANEEVLVENSCSIWCVGVHAWRLIFEFLDLVSIHSWKDLDHMCSDAFIPRNTRDTNESPVFFPSLRRLVPLSEDFAGRMSFEHQICLPSFLSYIHIPPPCPSFCRPFIQGSNIIERTLIRHGWRNGAQAAFGPFSKACPDQILRWEQIHKVHQAHHATIVHEQGWWTMQSQLTRGGHVGKGCNSFLHLEEPDSQWSSRLEEGAGRVPAFADLGWTGSLASASPSVGCFSEARSCWWLWAFGWLKDEGLNCSQH